MPVRATYPALFSIAGLLFFLLPLVPAKHPTEEISKADFSGSNTIFFNFNDLKIDEPTFVKAEVNHVSGLFYLNLWIGEGRENRITFVLKDENIWETAYELDHPSKRYLTLHYQGKACTYTSDEYYTGMLMIHKYDTTRKIIAASFEFMAWSGDCDELIRITNGMVDATYVAN